MLPVLMSVTSSLNHACRPTLQRRMAISQWLSNAKQLAELPRLRESTDDRSRVGLERVLGGPSSRTPKWASNSKYVGWNSCAGHSLTRISDTRSPASAFEKTWPTYVVESSRNTAWASRCCRPSTSSLHMNHWRCHRGDVRLTRPSVHQPPSVHTVLIVAVQSAYVSVLHDGRKC